MTNTPDTTSKNASNHHLSMREPSQWVRRFAPLIAAEGTVLDLACGGGRHLRHLLDSGRSVVGVDRNIDAVRELFEAGRAEIIEFDLESDTSAFAPEGPLSGRTFDAIIVTNYLFRPLFPDIINGLAAGGVLLYETFALGNEVYSRPRNPDHLLGSGELLKTVEGRLQVVAYEHGIIEGSECPGVAQRICAVNNLTNTPHEDGEPEPVAIHPKVISS